jgi:transcriptional regulator with XRE-family HTH domain
MTKKKPSFSQGFETQLATDSSFRRQVEETLNEMRLEQDLVALREARGVSQAQLAKALGVSQPAIAKLESGKAKNIKLRTLVRAVSALGGTVRIQITKRNGERRKKVDILTPRSRSAA